MTTNQTRKILSKPLAQTFIFVACVLVLFAIVVLGGVSGSDWTPCAPDTSDDAVVLTGIDEDTPYDVVARLNSTDVLWGDTLYMTVYDEYVYSKCNLETFGEFLQTCDSAPVATCDFIDGSLSYTWEKSDLSLLHSPKGCRLDRLSPYAIDSNSWKSVKVLDFPPRSELQNPFWIKVREKLIAGEELTLHLTFKDCGHMFEQDVRINGCNLSDSGELVYFNEINNRSNDLGETNSSPKVVRIGSRKYDARLLFRDGGALLDCLSIPSSGVIEWNRLEQSLYRGSMYDELTFARLLCDYYRSISQEAQRQALEKTTQWLSQLPSSQRYAFMWIAIDSKNYAVDTRIQEKQRKLINTLKGIQIQEPRLNNLETVGEPQENKPSESN
ncbi:MAG: hypothetical protein Q4G03_06630 [Planctomycetia bacterium]|nr:hypothetical protein [Planctomycetia bacterium]